MSTKEQALPIGVCWCGCGENIPPTSYFKPGHDKTAEAGVIMKEYGSVPQFLLEHGYGPGKKSARAALEESRKVRKRFDDEMRRLLGPNWQNATGEDIDAKIEELRAGLKSMLSERG